MSKVDELRTEYAELCARRDAINAEIAPLLAERERIVNEAEALRVRAEELSSLISLKRGGAAWIKLKKDIGTLAPIVSRRN